MRNLSTATKLQIAKKILAPSCPQAVIEHGKGTHRIVAGLSNLARAFDATGNPTVAAELRKYARDLEYAQAALVVMLTPKASA